MRRAMLLFALVAMIAGARAAELPAGVKAALDKADTLLVFSLDPIEPKEKPKGHFHGWNVLGVTEVKKPEARKALLAALHKGAAGGTAAKKCFEPRHGLRAKVGDKTYDLVICYACGYMQVFTDDKQGDNVLTDNSSATALDKVLKDGKVPRPEK